MPLAIQSEAKRITKIIRELLDFARQTTPNRDHHALNDIIVSTANLMRPLASKRGVEIKLDLPPAAVGCGFRFGTNPTSLDESDCQCGPVNKRSRFDHHHVVQGQCQTTWRIPRSRRSDSADRSAPIAGLRSGTTGPV